jgi:hypothetical protein
MLDVGGQREVGRRVRGRTWVYTPHLGGRAIPPAVRKRTERRILEHGQRRYAGRYTRLRVRFNGALCYIDAYVEPDPPTRSQLRRLGETREQYLERCRDWPIHLCRLRYFGNEDAWTLAFCPAGPSGSPLGGAWAAQRVAAGRATGHPEKEPPIPRPGLRSSGPGRSIPIPQSRRLSWPTPRSRSAALRTSDRPGPAARGRTGRRCTDRPSPLARR